MTLPYVNQFNPPYEQWQTRKPTQEEINDRITRKLHPLEWDAEIKIRCVDTIDTPEKAADYTLRYNDYEVIDHAITNSLNSPKSSYEQCQKKMPSQAPKILSNYQSNYSCSSKSIDFEEVHNAIMVNGDTMAKGQVLFHGGSIASGLKIGEFIKTDRPFSTSFSPVKALLNALHLGKAYDENQVNLLILRVVNSKTKAFIFNINEIDKGHEKEVLFASNLTLTLRKKTPIAKNYTVYGYEYSGSNCTPKDVPAYLLHIDIS